MPLDVLRIGLLFTSFVELLDMLSALFLVIFLLKRWMISDSTTRAYFIFWIFTFLVWTTSMIRYVVVALGFERTLLEHALSITTQMFVFSGGPVLFYYVGSRTLQMKSRMSLLFSIPPCLLTIWSFILLLSPGGITTPNINYFSADSVINRQLFYIFGAQIIILLSLLIYDVFFHYRAWYFDRSIVDKNMAFHSAALILYLILGTMDQAKIFVGWPLVLFRSLYSASFLFVYVVISHDYGGREEYLTTKISTQ